MHEDDFNVKDALLGVGGALPFFVPLELLGQGEAAVFAGLASGLVCYVYGDKIAQFLKTRAPSQQHKSNLKQWLLSRPGEVREEDEEGAAPKEEGVFAPPTNDAATLPVRRLTIEEIVKHTTRNSYQIWIGRSLTKKKHYPAVQMNLLGRHLKLIGASQYGKSSMAAALLEIILRTHDRRHIIVALLDLEYKTSRLFEQVPQLARLRVNDRVVPLHAKNYEQVLEYSDYILAIMNQRYELSELEILEQPVLLVYIEEFLALKDYFKRRINQAKSAEEKAQAQEDYERLVFNISEIARRGLKARVQLLLCAQVDYRDDDFREALINIAAGMSFCVQPVAARASGFYNTPLLNRNVEENQVGQAVVEAPDCKDLVLAPDYDLRHKLQELARTQPPAPVASKIRPLRPGLKPTQTAFVARNEEAQENHASTLEIEESHATFARNEMTLRPDEKLTQTTQTDANDGFVRKTEALRPDEKLTQTTQNDARYRLSDEQVKMFIALYPNAISNKDKCLEAIGANTAYRQHANELIQRYNLLEKKQG
jgi:hypothetical protein